MSMPLWVKQYLYTQFESSSYYMTDDAKQWMNSVRRWFNKFLKDVGGTNFAFHRGHYYWSCFFKIGDQWWYCMSSDCRFKTSDWLLVRTVTGMGDYTGGVNQQARYNDNFEQNMRHILGVD